MKRQILIVSALCALTLTGCHHADELECPTPQLQSSDGDLKESADNIRAYQDRLSGDFSENAISEAVASLRLKYPDAKNDAIANYLVAAYCPIITKRETGISEQRAKLASFENAVHAVLGD